MEKEKASWKRKQEEIRTQWEKEGFSCALWVDPPGQKWENFVHAEDEKVLLLEGKMEFEHGGRKKVLHPGDEDFIPAGEVHSARNIGKTTAYWLYGYRRREK